MAAINKLLRLPALGTEQDWEIELADGARLLEFLEAFETVDLDLDERSALALLLLFSITYAQVDVGPEILTRARNAIRMDADVLRRMQTYWSGHFAQHEASVKAIVL